jgi:hypothetical protein
MPARTKTYRDLLVTFYRQGEHPEVLVAANGDRAWAHAIMLISQKSELKSGDTLTVRRPDDFDDFEGEAKKI